MEDILNMLQNIEPRPATLDDVEDDCPLCLQMKARIEAGDPPMLATITTPDGETGIVQLS